MDKQKLIQELLVKRFGEDNPKNISNIVEINTFSSNAQSEDLGLGVQLILENDKKETIKEEYQISEDGIIFSWGNSPVIDERSLSKKLI